MEKLEEKLKRKKEELKRKINNNKKDIEIINNNLFPKRYKTILLAIPVAVLISLIPAGTVLQIVAFLGGLGGILYIDKNRMMKNKKSLCEMMNTSNPLFEKAIRTKINKELEIAKDKNSQKIINNVSNNIKSGKVVNNQEYSKEDLLDNKNSINILTTQKYLRENYSQVKNASSKNQNLLFTTGNITFLVALLSCFSGMSNLTSALLLAASAQTLLWRTNKEDLAYKKELLYINNNLLDHPLSMDELSDKKTYKLERELNKRLTVAADMIYANDKEIENKARDVKTSTSIKTKAREKNYNLLFSNYQEAKEKPKTYKLTK